MGRCIKCGKRIWFWQRHYHPVSMKEIPYHERCLIPRTTKVIEK